MFLAIDSLRKTADQVKGILPNIPDYIKGTQETLSKMRGEVFIDEVYKENSEKEANEDDNIGIDEKNNEESGEGCNEEN